MIGTISSTRSRIGTMDMPQKTMTPEECSHPKHIRDFNKRSKLIQSIGTRTNFLGVCAAAAATSTVLYSALQVSELYQSIGTQTRAPVGLVQYCSRALLVPYWIVLVLSCGIM